MSLVTANPTNESTEMVIDRHTPEEVEYRIAQTARAAVELRNTTFAQRAAWMHTAADILEQQAEELGELITIEMGKPIQQSVAEVNKYANAMSFYAVHD